MADLGSRAPLSWKAKLLIAVGLAVFVLPVLYVAAIMIALKAHAKDDCRMQLRHLGMRLREHAASHAGQFASRWSELEWDDIEGIENTSWNRMFICPAVGHEIGDWSEVDLWADYRLLPGLTTNDPPDTVFAIEPLSNHESGVNVLFIDGSSAWWPVALVTGQESRAAATP